MAGVDEAGRGPLAGPVVAAAVILPSRWPVEVPLPQDSKVLRPAARWDAYRQIRRRAVACALGVLSAAEVDRLNILQATMVAMRLAVERLNAPPLDFVLIDGNRLPALKIEARAVVGGDRQSVSIAAASIVAKVTRDAIMTEMARYYPGWGFAQHKGYGTVAHRRRVLAWGRSRLHRTSFAVRAPAPST